MKLLLMVTLLSSVVFASKDTGGGDALVCDEKGKKTALFWDLYEGLELGRVDKYLSTKGRTYREIIEARVKIIRKYDELIGKELEEISKELVHAVETYEQTGRKRVGSVLFSSNFIDDVKDTGILSYPENCKVVQAAVRVTKVYDEDPEFKIRTSFWKNYSTLSKAALILHESIYKVFAETFQHESSNDSRYFNQKILSASFKSANFFDYLELRRKIKTEGEMLFIINDSSVNVSLREVKEGFAIFNLISPTSRMNLNYRGLSFKTEVIALDREGEINIKKTKNMNKRALFVAQTSEKGVQSGEIKLFLNDELVCHRNYSEFSANKIQSSMGVNLCHTSIGLGKHKVRLVISQRSIGEGFYIDELRLGTKYNIKTLIDFFEVPFFVKRGREYSYEGDIVVE